MDFNEIKHIWKDSFNKNKRLSYVQIEAMLKIKSRSNTALAKIKSSFKFELITGTLMYLFIISALFILINIPQSIIFFVIVSLLMGLPLFLFYQTYKKIRYSIYTEDNLKQSLEKTVRDIEKFVIFGKNNYVKFAMIPLATITGMFIGLYIGTGKNDIVEILQSLETRKIIKMIVLLVVFSGVLIPLSRYWFKKKFKQHYNELKQCQEELEE